jgi:hypothetical protein
MDERVAQILPVKRILIAHWHNCPALNVDGLRPMRRRVIIVWVHAQGGPVETGAAEANARAGKYEKTGK